MRIIDRRYEVAAILDNSIEEGVGFKDDRLKTTLVNGFYTLELTILKTNTKHQEVSVGNMIELKTRHGKQLLMTITKIDENNFEKKVYAEETTITALNMFVDPIDEPLRPEGIAYYYSRSLLGTDIKVRRSEVSITKQLNLSNQQRLQERLIELAKQFEAELSYGVEFTPGKKPAFYIDFLKKRVEDPEGFRISSDDLLLGLEREVNVYNLATKLMVAGKAVDINEKTKKKNQQSSSSKPPQGAVKRSRHEEMLNKMINWMKSKEGRSWYSQAQRTGPNSFDCSSAVHYALVAGGFKQAGGWPGSTVTMWNEIGPNKLMTQINRSEARRGDIFLSGARGAASAGNSGHTGIFLDNNTIIHCTTGNGRSGVMTTSVSWSGQPLYCFRLNRRD